MNGVEEVEAAASASEEPLVVQRYLTSPLLVQVRRRLSRVPEEREGEGVICSVKMLYQHLTRFWARGVLYPHMISGSRFHICDSEIV